MKASVPSVTWPNHTSLVTGDNPARHGVVGNNYLDRETGKPVALIQDPIFDKEQIVKTPTIYDVAKQAGLKTAAVGWPASRNAKTLDWTIPDTKADILEQYTTPSLLAECKAADLWPDSGEPADPAAAKAKPAKGRAPRKAMTEEHLTNIFVMILQKHRPNLALLHIADVDHNEHKYGRGPPRPTPRSRPPTNASGAYGRSSRRITPGGRRCSSCPTTASRRSTTRSSRT